jgi:hypothetical protein
MTGKGSGKRGRPLGYRLSEATKRSISVSKTGQRHRSETRDKISRSLRMYFRKCNLLSDEIVNRYCRADDDVLCDWVYDVQDQLDSSMDIIPEKILNNRSKIEIRCGEYIEYLSHSLTPEFMVILKEEIKGLGEEDKYRCIQEIFEDVL